MRTSATTKEVATQPQPICNPLQCGKACISLQEITDGDILAELKRRGYKGELKIIKTVYV